MNVIKKIIYVTHARLPTEKAHGRATVKLCEAFAREGVDVELVIPRLWSAPLEIFKKSDIFSFYRVSRTFEVSRLFCVDLTWMKMAESLTYPLRFFSFSKWAALYLGMWYRGSKDVMFFSHDIIPLYFLSFVCNNIFYDIHDFPPDNFLGRRVMKKSAGFSVQTRAKIPLLAERFGIDPAKIVYWPNGTEIEKFDISIPKEEARKKLSLPLGEKIIVYTGSLFDWKGVDTLVGASAFLQGIKIFVIGGGEEDVKKMRQDIFEAGDRNVVFAGSRSHDEIPLWLRAADALVLPNTAKKEISRLWTSPMKLFEYMASGAPIVASRIPSIEEVVTDDMVFFAEPDSPQSFAATIEKVFAHPDEAKKRALYALEEVKKYTWHARAHKILEHIKILKF